MRRGGECEEDVKAVVGGLPGMEEGIWGMGMECRGPEVEQLGVVG